MEAISDKRRKQLWRKSGRGEVARVGDFPHLHPTLLAYELKVQELENKLNKLTTGEKQ